MCITRMDFNQKHSKSQRKNHAGYMASSGCVLRNHIHVRSIALLAFDITLKQSSPPELIGPFIIQTLQSANHVRPTTIFDISQPNKSLRNWIAKMSDSGNFPRGGDPPPPREAMG